jgi:hypothetical protein
MNRIKIYGYDININHLGGLIMKRRIVALCLIVGVFASSTVGCTSTSSLERQNDAIEKAADKQIKDAQDTLKAVDKLESFFGQ